MTTLPYILFCQSPLQSNKVDEDFEDQFIAAKENGFQTLLFSYDDLLNPETSFIATKKIKPATEIQRVIYRGWMLTPHQYELLFQNLLAKNYQLINTLKQYKNCHYLPDSLQFIGDHTALTVFEAYVNADSIDNLLAKAEIFGDKPLILKDYVKSEKHDWHDACFVEKASNKEKLKETINNLLKLRGKYLNEGLVAREFIELKSLTNHSKSGMPLTEEYRLFFCNKKLIEIYDYWEEGDYALKKPDLKEFENLAKTIDSNFFSMDVACKKSGEFIIIELGDGQVAGLPDNTNRNDFYKRMKEC